MFPLALPRLSWSACPKTLLAEALMALEQENGPADSISLNPTRWPFDIH